MVKPFAFFQKFGKLNENAQQAFCDIRNPNYQ